MRNMGDEGCGWWGMGGEYRWWWSRQLFCLVTYTTSIALWTWQLFLLSNACDLLGTTIILLSNTWHPFSPSLQDGSLRLTMQATFICFFNLGLQYLLEQSGSCTTYRFLQLYGRRYRLSEMWNVGGGEWAMANVGDGGYMMGIWVPRNTGDEWDMRDVGDE